MDTPESAQPEARPAESQPPKPKPFRVCYQTFQTNVDNPDLKLLNCSKCKTAKYVSVEAQRANWPFHKINCNRPEVDKVKNMSMKDVTKRCLEWPSVDHNSALCFKRLLEYFQAHEADKKGKNSKKDLGMDIGDVGLGLHRRLFNTEQRLVGALSCFWATPGIPELLLQHKGHSIKRTLLKPGKHYSQGTDAYEYFYFVCTVLTFSGVTEIQQTMASIHDGLGKIRTNSPWALAAANKLLDLWMDPKARQDCGDAFAPGPSLMLTWLQHGKKERIDLINRGAIHVTIDCWVGGNAGAETYCKKIMALFITYKDEIEQNISNLRAAEILQNLFVLNDYIKPKNELFVQLFVLLEGLFVYSPKAEERWKYLVDSPPPVETETDEIDEFKEERQSFLRNVVQKQLYVPGGSKNPIILPLLNRCNKEIMESVTKKMKAKKPKDDDMRFDMTGLDKFPAPKDPK